MFQILQLEEDKHQPNGFFTTRLLSVECEAGPTTLLEYDQLAAFIMKLKYGT